MSDFHHLNGYYAEGLHTATVTLPSGWRDRLVSWNLRSSEPAEPRFLDPHDLAVAKPAAGRDKDLRFVAGLLEVGLLRIAVLHDPMGLVDDLDLLLDKRIRGWLERYG